MIFIEFFLWKGCKFHLQFESSSCLFKTNRKIGEIKTNKKYKGREIFRHFCLDKFLSCLKSFYLFFKMICKYHFPLFKHQNRKLDQPILFFWILSWCRIYSLCFHLDCIIFPYFWEFVFSNFFSLMIFCSLSQLFLNTDIFWWYKYLFISYWLNIIFWFYELELFCFLDIFLFIFIIKISRAKNEFHLLKIHYFEYYSEAIEPKWVNSDYI